MKARSALPHFFYFRLQDGKIRIVEMSSSHTPEDAERELESVIGKGHSPSFVERTNALRSDFISKRTSAGGFPIYSKKDIG